MSRHDTSNHSNQMNPNNDVYWESRGYEERPGDWEEHLDRETGHREQAKQQEPVK